ncbi:hypothetical protein D3C73_712140 [compost metagenome]
MIREQPLTADNYRHMAAVFRTEANARRLNDPHFAGWLDAVADKKDRQAMAAATPAQPDLFGAAA